VSLKVSKGEHVVIFAPARRKSTLLRMMNLLEVPTWNGCFEIGVTSHIPGTC